ncbi:hypothetical protein BSIN_2198 [Burkholderia singularis]|uniref:Uncharacterized protein n=1 Tax=Burkholderia singularis TaxID=1503053 RepID=A0A238H1A8_9BURK|nr:hypothetical protein BSIN_2198 [Burkholderia singularis]
MLMFKKIVKDGRISFALISQYSLCLDNKDFHAVLDFIVCTAQSICYVGIRT